MWRNNNKLSNFVISTVEKMGVWCILNTVTSQNGLGFITVKQLSNLRIYCREFTKTALHELN